jgi:pimeloyl-ACP methyl ester carboxylesterase
MGLLVAAAALLAATTAPVFSEKPCTDSRLAKLARCGTVSVPEDRQRPDRRKIALNVIVMVATPADVTLPPLFEIDGGPGLPVTKNVAFYATDGAAYRAGRDIVLVDQRGTGGSNPLHCPGLNKPGSAYQPLYPVVEVRACRRTLEKAANLTKYGTAEAVADLDAVRAALGYRQIDLFGVSYGSTVALRYVATHPGRVRAAVLIGVSPANATPPKGHAPAGKQALQKLIGLCRSDAACAAAFDPAADMERVRTRLRSIPDAPSEEVFFEKLRSLMYQPAGARRLPFILSRAAAGDLAPFFAATKSSFAYADGMAFSVICPEGMALMDVMVARSAAKATPFGDYRLRRQQEACAHWPVAKVPADHVPPVRSNTPVLLISGELDPVTPPALADEVAKTLPNAKHVVIPESGHMFDGMSGVDSCLDPLILRFLKSGDAKSLDASCIATMKPPPFIIQGDKAATK